ncbi:MAG: glycosyltransferase involved in cell wall biosynthesis [Paraglaciecola sp.]|jgi:glycosyltransferase involved in cell wall biosynthesis
MKVAVVHDWLVDMGGAEKVLKSIMNLYSDADVFSLVCSMNEKELFSIGIKKPVKTSFIQKLPKGVKKYRSYLPLMPLAIQQLDLSEYDLIISSSYCVAKGVITGPDQLHISYCHSPVRYAWDLQGQYLKESGLERGFKSMLARYFLNKIRDFDVRSSFAVDHFIANSTFIKRRIEKFYRRHADVIYPPVDTHSFTLKEEKQDYYVTCSRLVPYKKVDLIVNAFRTMPEKQLVVVGEGPDYDKINVNLPNNIKLLGFVEYDALIAQVQNAKAFVYAAEEDFGIVPVEAQACGTPVIGFGKGGLLDTVKDGITGVHFGQQTVESIVAAVNKFESTTDLAPAKAISEHAQKFASQRFENELHAYVNEKLQKSELFRGGKN